MPLACSASSSPDGDAVVVGVEHAPLLSLPSDASLAPGAKFALAPDARVERRRGLLLFSGDQLRPIGGRVPELAETWERRRAFEASGAGSEAEAMKLSGAPEFRHFDAEEAAQMAREAAAAKDRAHRVAIAAAAENARRDFEGFRDCARNRAEGFDRRAGERERAGGVRTAAATRASPDPRATRSRRRRGRSPPGAGTTARSPASDFVGR